MSIAAANVAPNFLIRRSLTADELLRLQEPVVLYEYDARDDDGVPFFVYTIAGWLDGRNIATSQGGCTMGGQVIIVNADSREQADHMAADGLGITINGFEQDARDTQASKDSLARLTSVGATERMNQAMRPDKNEDFVKDAAAIQKLRGDDIVLVAGRMASQPGLKNIFPSLH